jgi:hypothetical protein
MIKLRNQFIALSAINSLAYLEIIGLFLYTFQKSSSYQMKKFRHKEFTNLLKSSLILTMWLNKKRFEI